MITLLFRPVVAALLTLGMFLLMRYMILPPEQDPVQEEPGPVIDITRPERNETSEPKKRERPEKPQQKDLPPLPPPIPSLPTPAAKSSGMALVLPTFDDDIGGSLTNPSSRRATPIVRIPPQYPARSLARGIEGWVIAEFTITIGGTVENAIIVDAEPQGLFDRSVIQAIQRWKYQPKIVDGKPVPQHHMRELFTFKIER